VIGRFRIETTGAIAIGIEMEIETIGAIVIIAIGVMIGMAATVETGTMGTTGTTGTMGTMGTMADTDGMVDMVTTFIRQRSARAIRQV